MNQTTENQSSPAVLIYLKTQFSNAGDAFIIREQIRLFRELGNIQAFRSDAPTEFIEATGLLLEETKDGGWLRMIGAALHRTLFDRRAPYLLLPPGDPGGGLTLGTLARSVTLPIISLLGVKIVRVGFSLGGLTAARMKAESWISRWCHFQGIRDNLSLRDAKNYAFRNFGYFPDLSLNFPHELIFRELGSTAGPRIGISFRDDNLNEADRVKTIGALFKSIEPYRNTASLRGIIQVSRDLPFVERIMHEAVLRGFSVDENHLISSNLEELMSEYSQTDLVVTNRLHVFLLGALAGALPFAVIDGRKNRKIAGILSTIGLGGFSMEIEEPGNQQFSTLSSLSMATVTNALQQQKSEIRAGMKAIVDKG